MSGILFIIGIMIVGAECEPQWLSLSGILMVGLAAILANKYEY